MSPIPKSSKPASTRGRPVLVQGRIEIEGREIEFQDINFLYEIAAGANGVVFAAHDKLLDRRIAVKIWNARGAARSQMETQKIAKISHPLFVITHRFGRSHGGDPFSIMEFVDGKSAKAWLRLRPPLAERLAVWRLYSRGLKHLYSKGVLHGDPHLGNVLVFSNEDESSHGHNIAIKIADTGTSAFWSSQNDFAKRENKLIIEAARLLFHDQWVRKILAIPTGVSHAALLDIIDTYSMVVWLTNVEDQDRRGLLSSQIEEQVTKSPVFNLDELLRFVAARPGTTANRLINRLNERLDHRPSEDEVWPEELTDRARASYESKRRDFTVGLRSELDQPKRS